jgi:uncharacterized membrane protein YfcA
MILFTSSTATVSYSIFGLLEYDYAAACLLLGLFSTLIGQKVMSALLKHHQRNSYIAYSIGIVVALSAVMMAAESVITLINKD